MATRLVKTAQKDINAPISRKREEKDNFEYNFCFATKCQAVTMSAGESLTVLQYCSIQSQDIANALMTRVANALRMR